MSVDSPYTMIRGDEVLHSDIDTNCHIGGLTVTEDAFLDHVFTLNPSDLPHKSTSFPELRDGSLATVQRDNRREMESYPRRVRIIERDINTFDSPATPADITLKLEFEPCYSGSKTLRYERSGMWSELWYKGSMNEITDASMFVVPDEIIAEEYNAKDITPANLAVAKQVLLE